MAGYLIRMRSRPDHPVRRLVTIILTSASLLMVGIWVWSTYWQRVTGGWDIFFGDVRIHHTGYWLGGAIEISFGDWPALPFLRRNCVIECRVFNLYAAPGWWAVHIAYPVLVVMTAAYPILVFARAAFRHRRRADRHLLGLCLECGFDLRGSPGGVCPECGKLKTDVARRTHSARDLILVCLGLGMVKRTFMVRVSTAWAGYTKSIRESNSSPGR